METATELKNWDLIEPLLELKQFRMEESWEKLERLNRTTFGIETVVIKPSVPLQNAT